MSNDERLRRVEERIAWLERHVLEQDKAMLELSELADRLRKDLTALQSRMAAGTGAPEGESPADERPPHY